MTKIVPPLAWHLNSRRILPIPHIVRLPQQHQHIQNLLNLAQALGRPAAVAGRLSIKDHRAGLPNVRQLGQRLIVLRDCFHSTDFIPVKSRMAVSDQSYRVA